MPVFDPEKELAKPFGSYCGLISAWGRIRGERPALICGDDSMSWRGLDMVTGRIAAQLQRDGLAKGQAVAILGATSISYALVYLAAVRAGGCAAPLTTSATPTQLADMIADSGAMHLFIDTPKRIELAESGVPFPPVTHVMLDESDGYAASLDDWMAAEGTGPDDPGAGADDPFNIIYSSGTTGTPKGIVHSRLMRWRQTAVGPKSGYGADSVTLLATPLYSNTTLGTFIPSMGYGGTVVMMPKFDCRDYLDLAQTHRATHTMLVPVQYRRLMDYPQFDDYDLDSFFLKYCTSAPFAAALKAQVAARWPGELVEIYSMTEGGVVCLLRCRQHPDKLHTVGRPHIGSEVRTIDADLKELPVGEKGELVGRSPTMMSGYKNQQTKTDEAIWIDTDGQRWQRMGDIGVVDADGFVTLMGRSKDMIISGGFNIYPRDLEDALCAQPGVADAAVIGVASERWGETPLGFVVAQKDMALDMDALLAATNAQLGKTQRLSALRAIDELPRSHIGKILKTDLRIMAGATESNNR